MIAIKQWHVSLFNENDVEYVKGLECSYEIHDSVKYREVEGYDGQIYRYIDPNQNYGLYITTKSKKQESLLMLKYSGNITLLRMFYVNELESSYDFETYF